MSTLYLVMNTFSGRYLTEQSNKNIGHENINFFMPENTNGKYLLWFNAGGTIDKKYLKNKTDITLLMVTNYANEPDKYRVLAKAENCQLVNGANITGLKKENREKRYKKFLESFNNATYGTQTIQDIFKDNTFHGEPDPENTLATFMTDPENVFVPNDKTYTIQIKNHKNKAPNADIKQNMSNEQMRMYISNENEFKNIISKIEWIPFDTTKKELPEYPLDIDYYTEKESVFTAMGTEKSELAISNMISYTLTKSLPLLNKLITFLIPNLTKVHQINSFEYSIDREDDHVDLRITIPGHTIIIENKIDSFIVEYPNCNIDDLKKKVKKSFKDIDKTIFEKHWDEFAKDLNDTDQLCQLTKYYIISQIQEDIKYEETQEKNKLHYFFLVPEYIKNKFKINKDNNVIGWKYSDKYKCITYKNLLYDVYSQINQYPYKEDIITEFNLLARDVDNSAQNRQIYNFLKKAGL